jgi:hypothetical protein
MRKSDVLLAGLAGGLFLLALSAVDTSVRGRASEAAVLRRAELVTALGLTDLALFTEARYTRHPTQADLHAAFQSHPTALDHFPSGSLQPPPAILTDDDELRPQAALSH